MKKGSTLIHVDVGGAAVVALLGALVYFGGVAPSVQAIRAAERERADLANQKGEAERLERSLIASHTKLEKVTIAEQGQARTDGGTALDRIGRISAIAAEAGVSVTDLSPKPEQPGTRFNRIPIIISGHGFAPSFQSLLKRLHSEFPDTQVASMTITATPEARESPAAFSAELVWYTVAKVAGQADKSVGAANSDGAGAPSRPSR